MSWDEIIDYQSEIEGEQDRGFKEDFEKAIADKLFLTNKDLFIRIFGLRAYREARLGYLKGELDQQIEKINNKKKRSPAK